MGLDQLLHNSEPVFYTLASIALVIGCVKYLHEWFSNYQDTQNMTREIAFQHLPYIYRGLALIAKRLDVELEDAPQITMQKPTWRHKEEPTVPQA